jgi:RND family efflux transporter MFP subunit
MQPIGRIALACLLVATAAGCKKQNAYAPPPPPQVGVAKPEQHRVTPYIEATGTTVAYNSVSLTARIEGFVEAIQYKDGARVKKDDTLFVIEPPPYQAKLQQAQSAVASAQAQVVQSDAEFQRQLSLGRNDFTPRSTVDQARATRDTNQANLVNQQAGLTLAQINLSYTRVTAPFDGVVSQHLVSVGALVGATGPTKLASIVQLDPIYVTFQMTEQDVQRIRADLAQAGLTVAEIGKIAVEIGLMTEEGFPHAGVLDYADPQVDTSTGTLTVRAVLDNPKASLLPGYFVRVRVPRSTMAHTALLVPDAALGASQAGPYLLVLGKDDVVEQRSVRTGQLYGMLRAVEEGLQTEDRVIVTGLARAIPGEKVAPATAELATPEPR